MGTTREEQDACTEVRVIDSQLQHFRNYFDVIQVYKCRLCTFCSPHDHVIASHMSEVHFPRRCFLCKQCLFVFEDRAQLASHLDSAHGTQSVTVCFGESGTYTSSPPVWSMAGNRMGSDGREHSLQSNDSTEELRNGETRNGRVSSSTGNLSKEAQSQSVSVDHPASSGMISADEQQHGARLATSEGNLERMQSNGSICHPSTTTRFSENADTDSNPARLSHESSLENQSDLQRSPDLVISPVPGDEIPGRRDPTAIKVEPVSPVTGNTLGGSGGSFSEDGEGGGVKGDEVDDPDDIHIICSDSPQLPNTAEMTASDREGGAQALERATQPYRQNSLTPSESGRRGIFRRQATVDLPDCDHDESRSPRGSELSAQQGSTPRSQSRGRDEDVVGGERGSRRGSPQENLEQQHGDHSMNDRNNMSELSPGRPSDNYPPSHSTLRDLVRGNREGGSHPVLESSRSMEINSEPQPMARSMRVRSHSITEGEIPQETSRAPPTKDYHPPPDTEGGVSSNTAPHRIPSIQVSQHIPGAAPTYFPHGYHSLVYQPRSWDGDRANMYRSLAPPGHPNHPEYRPGPIRSRSEEVPSIVPSSAQHPAEDSVLYKYLQKNGMPKRSRGGRLALGSPSHSADGDLSHPAYYMPAMNDLARRGLLHSMPWASSSSSMSSHGGSFGVYTDHQPSATSASQQGGAGGQPSPEGYRYHRSGSGAENSQDLAHVEDLTRQVQRAVGSASLYGPAEPHPLVAMHGGSGGSPQSCSHEEDEMGSGGKDMENGEVKKRSRKSTFNIYREIPERKRKLDRDEEERIKHSYNPDGSFDYFSLTGWKAYKCGLCKKRRFKTASELDEHMGRKHPNEKDHHVSHRQSPPNPPVGGPGTAMAQQERAFSPGTNG